MAEPQAGNRRVVRFVVEALIGATLLAMVVGLALYLRSAQFEDLVRRRVVAFLEQATGGRVDLESLHWSLSKLEIEAHNLTIHGLEGAGEAPYVHVDRFFARCRILSVLKTKIDLTSLILDRPQVHIIVRSDGSTNAPEPRVPTERTRNVVQQLFELAVGRTDLRDGSLLYNQQVIPLDFSANDVRASLTYDRRDKHYDGAVQVGKINAKYQDYREVPAQAELTFRVWQNHGEIKTLHLSSQNSHIDVRGEVLDFANPRARITYSGSANLAQVAAVIRDYHVVSGIAAFDGSANYAAAAYSSTGKISIRELHYSDDGLELRNASASAEFVLDPYMLRLRKLAVHMLGGEIAGDAEVKNYRGEGEDEALAVVSAEPRRATRDKSGNKKAATTVSQLKRVPQEGRAHLRLSRVSLSEVLRMLSTRSRPLDQVKLAAGVDGVVDLSWKKSIAESNADLALDLVPLERTAADQVPVTGTLRGRYDLRSQVLDVQPLKLATANTHLDASGRLGSATAALDVTVTTSKLKEVEPLLISTGASLPFELKGQASFTGTLSGPIRSPAIAGHLEATDITYLYSPPQPGSSAANRSSREVHRESSTARPATVAANPAQDKRVHLDSFSGDVQYSSTALALQNGVMTAGGTSVKASGQVNLHKGAVTDASSFEIQVAFQKADVTLLQQIIGTDYPVAGTADLSVQAKGTPGDPQAQGTFAISSALIYGQPVGSASATFTFGSNTLHLSNVRASAPAGVLVGSGMYNVQSKAFEFEARADEVNLGRIPELQARRLTVAGTARLAAKGSGTINAPVIDAHLRVVNLVLDEERVGGLTLDVMSHGPHAQVTGRSNFQRASFALDGSVEMSGNMPADLHLQFSNLDVDPFLRVEVKGRITGHSRLAGHANISGPLRVPRALQGNLSVDAFEVEIEKIPIKSDGPLHLALSNGVVTVERLMLTSSDTRFAVAGTMNIRKDRALDLRANGHVNLAVLQTIEPELEAAGGSNIDVLVQGTLSKPLITGRVEVVHAGFSSLELPAALADLNGTLLFNQDRLEVEQLTGRVGGGQIRFAGYATYGRTISFHLTSLGNDIRFRYAGISLTANQNLTLEGTLQNAYLSGDITVLRFAQIPTSDLLSMFANSPAQLPNPASPLNNLHLDIRITSAPELTVQTALAKLAGDADLRLRGTGSHPVLLGRINIAEGDVKLAGTKYHIERGDVTFSNPVRIDPILDVEGTTRVRDFEITIGLHGTLERLVTTYRSDPPLSSEEIVGLLAFGRTQQQGASGNTVSSGFAESASSALLGEAINQTVTNRVSRLFGVSSIKINPAIGGPDNNPNARLTVEQQVSSEVTITYITNLARSAQQVIQFEYNITRDYTIEAIRDENGVLSFDVLVRKRRK